MKAKLILTVFGVLGLVFITGCTCTQKTSLRCLPCENAKPVDCAPAPAPAPVAVKPVSNCLPCEQKKVAYVAPTPAPAPAPVVVKRDCLDCVNGQPDYSEYQWR
ncbi:MAG: hypothetical protein ACF8OB_19510 [Phycisphaeraceae bacterium JB051]